MASISKWDRIQMDYHQNRNLDTTTMANPFLKLLKSGEVPMSVLDDKEQVVSFGLFSAQNGYNPSLGPVLACDEHSQTARKIAEEELYCSKNEKQLLPVATEKYRKIAVIGENATRSVTFGVDRRHLKSEIRNLPLDGLIQSMEKDKNSIQHGLCFRPFNVGSLNYLRH